MCLAHSLYVHRKNTRTRTRVQLSVSLDLGDHASQLNYKVLKTNIRTIE